LLDDLVELFFFVDLGRRAAARFRRFRSNGSEAVFVAICRRLEAALPSRTASPTFFATTPVAAIAAAPRATPATVLASLSVNVNRFAVLAIAFEALLNRPFLRGIANARREIAE
jgi:hypothetical protein